MRTLNDVKCHRCGVTASGMWIESGDLTKGHACPDGGTSDSFSMTTRVVMGTGERGSDCEPSFVRGGGR